MNRPIRLCAAIPFYAIGAIISIGGSIYFIISEIKAFTMLFTDGIAPAIVAFFLYPIVAGIIFGIGSLIFKIGEAIHGKAKPDPVVPAWETHL